MHLGAQVAGIDPPDPDSRLLRRQHMAGLLECGLGRAVAAPARVRFAGRIRGDAEDRAATRAQIGEQQLRQRDGCDDVHLERCTQLFGRVIGERRQRAGAECSGVVDQQTGAAEISGRGGQLGPVRGICDVAGQRYDRPLWQVVLGAYCGGRSLESQAVARIDDQLIAGCSQGTSQSAAEAAGCAGDDRY